MPWGPDMYFAALSPICRPSPSRGGLGGDGFALRALRREQSFHSPAASGLLLALPKSRQKARHRTRCSDSHRANRNPLCFSPAPGCSDSTSMYCFASAAIHRRAPSGFFRHGLRCSAPRTAPLVHETVRPCTASRCEGGKLWLLPLLLRQDAAETGPPEARRGCVGSVRRRAHTMCARSLNVHGRTSSEPRSTLAKSEGRMPGDRADGGVFLWLPFFAQAKKVTRSPQASGSFALLEGARAKINVDSRLRGNDEREKAQRSVS